MVDFFQSQLLGGGESSSREELKSFFCVCHPYYLPPYIPRVVFAIFFCQRIAMLYTTAEGILLGPTYSCRVTTLGTRGIYPLPSLPIELAFFVTRHVCWWLRDRRKVALFHNPVTKETKPKGSGHSRPESLFFHVRHASRAIQIRPHYLNPGNH